MKKEHLQQHINELARQVQYFQDREERRAKRQADDFEKALMDANTGAEVQIITSAGYRFMATVVNARADIDVIDVGDGMASRYLPGRRTVRLELEPRPE